MIPTQIGDVTISQAVAWVIAAAAAIAAISKAVEILKGFLGHGKIEDKLKKHDQLLDNDNRRLIEIESAIKEQQRAQAVMCQGMLSLINHQLSGNDIEKLRGARDTLINFLTTR